MATSVISGVRVQFNDKSRFARNLRKKGARAFASRLQRIGDAIAQEASAIVKEEFVVDRPPWRRRPGPRLHGSFYFRVDKADSFPLRGRVLSRAAKVKVNSLNYGSRPHQISSSKGLLVPMVKTRVVFRSLSGKRSSTTLLSFGDASFQAHPGLRGEAWGKKKFWSVYHPGTKPTKFLQRAERRVKDRVRAGGFRRA
jgi:hypothetical protein